jgi:23S rRNA (guanine2445-N2)-methyltransferase / 23S rRNA (guanine2069-N7)-methyltransferase
MVGVRASCSQQYRVESRPPAQFDLLATCTFGLEAVVARELEQLGYDASVVGTGRVLFRGDERAICDANLWLRAADRVLIRVGMFDADNFDALFEGVKGLAWERWIAREAAFPVAGRCVRSQLSSEPAVQRATKRAIVDRLKAVHARGGLDALLPETGPQVAVEVSILRDVATLTIDTSGAGLHKRGYREGVQPGEAALRETLAAGLVLLSVWRPGRPLVDPFCGSGTIAIEAAMIGRSIAPGLNRPSGFDAERWVGSDGKPLIDPAAWDEAREEARASIVPDRLDPVIHASDVSEEGLRLARRNARVAGVENDIQFLRRDVADFSSTKEFGVVVTNPPYGMRIGAGGEDEERTIERLYRSLPGVFRRLPTWTFHILSGRLDLERLFGQVASRRRKLYNSRIECTYFTFLGPRPERPERGGTGETRERAEEGGSLAPGASDLSPDEALHLVGEDEGDAPQSTEVAVPDTDSSAPPSPVAPVPPRSSSPAFGGLRERDEREAAEFGRCLANNLRHLRKYPARGIFCYRVYERDVPDVPLIVDRYQAEGGEVFFHAAEYQREHSRTGAQQADWFDIMRRTIAEVGGVPPANVFMKEKHRQAGLTQHEKVSSARSTLIVREGEPGLKFEVNLSDYIDTGLFLDHRLTRRMFREEAAKRPGARVLNLFCYTGSFSVYAASAGAVTTSVDLSNTYLDWARRNLGHNNLYSNQHRLVRSDVIEFLREEALARLGEPGYAGKYDLAIVDPPTFSNSKSTQQDWEVASSHAELLGLLGPLISSGGVVYFSSNFRRFKLDEQAAAEAGFTFREISRRTVPPEYRNKRIHRCWRMVMVGAEAAIAERADRQASAAARTESPPADDVEE